MGDYKPNCQAVLQVQFDGFDAAGRAGVLGASRFGPVGREAGDVEILVQPLSATILRNSYKEADTFRLEFDALSLPLAPKQIKGGSAEIFLYDTDYLGQGLDQLGQDGGVRRLRQGKDHRPRIVGLFDEADLSFSDDGRTFSIDGKDYTDLFLGREWQPQRRRPAGQRIDDVLWALIDEVDKAGKLRLVTPGINLAALGDVGRHAVRTNKKGKPLADKASYWDVMYDIAIDHGFILFVEGLDVVLTTPQDLTAERAKTMRRFAWGRNLKSLSISRHLGKEKTPLVRVKCWDPKGRRLVEGWFPERGQVGEGVGTERKQVITYVVHDVTSEAQCRKIAETRYNLRARAEQTVKFATDDLEDLNGLDNLDLHSGDPVAIDLDPFNAEVMERLDPAQRRAVLRSEGFQPSVADVVAENYDRIDLLRGPFRTHEARLDWDHEDGISVEVEAQEFVNIDEALRA